MHRKQVIWYRTLSLQKNGLKIAGAIAARDEPFLEGDYNSHRADDSDQIGSFTPYPVIRPL